MQPQLRTMLAEVLDIPLTHVTPALVRGETGAWDSLNHLRLMTAVEQEYGVSFTMDEIIGVRTPGDLEQAIERRTMGRGASVATSGERATRGS